MKNIFKNKNSKSKSQHPGQPRIFEERERVANTLVADITMTEDPRDYESLQRLKSLAGKNTYCRIHTCVEASLGKKAIQEILADCVELTKEVVAEEHEALLENLAGAMLGKDGVSLDKDELSEALRIPVEDKIEPEAHVVNRWEASERDIIIDPSAETIATIGSHAVGAGLNGAFSNLLINGRSAINNDGLIDVV